MLGGRATLGMTWYAMIDFSSIGSASSDCTSSGGSLAKASLVGANTVSCNGPLNTEVKFTVAVRLRRVEKLGLLATICAMVILDMSTGGSCIT